MSIKKITTIIGIVVICIGIGIGGYFVFQKGLISLKPDPTIIPKKIKITNLNNDRFTVTWVTDGKSQGSISYGQGSKLDQIQLDDLDQLTGQGKARKLHHVTVKNLNSANTYYFKIRSGEKNREFDKDGKPYSVKTAPALGSQPPTDIINGEVVTSSKKAAEGSIVFIDVAGITPLSTQVKKDGSWLISLSNARNTQLTSYANYDPKLSVINITVQGEGGASKVTTNTENKSPVPRISLGENFDFTKEEVGNVGIGEDEETENTDVDDGLLKPLENFNTDIVDVNIDNPDDGEELETTTPEFSGTGPEGTVLTLRVTGEEETDISTGTVTIDEDSTWAYTYSDPFELGTDYVLDIAYTDTEDEVDSVKIDFSISADADEESDPAIEASSSAQTSPSPSPTPTPSSSTKGDADDDTDDDASASATTPSPTASSSGTTKGGRVSMPSTSSGTPESGFSLPTILLLGLGLGLVISGYGFRKEKI